MADSAEKIQLDKLRFEKIKKTNSGIEHWTEVLLIDSHHAHQRLWNVHKLNHLAIFVVKFQGSKAGDLAP
jgi:hypothetical protein